MSKIILDLYGGTGSWSKPYQDAGYDVKLITLPNYDVVDYMPPPNVYGILAAPPCTHFSKARTTAKAPRDFEGAMGLVYAALKIIWQCRIEGSLKFWALENPTGYLRQFLGKPAYTFQPFDFGDPFQKPTDIWGYFKEPKKSKIKFDKNQYSLFTFKKYRQRGDRCNFPGVTHIGRKGDARRAITPPGFAYAFFKANQ